MLPKVEELVWLITKTKDLDVEMKCVKDLLDYQDIDDTIADLTEFIQSLEDRENKASDLIDKLTFYKNLKKEG